jgi:hypothetical protein
MELAQFNGGLNIVTDIILENEFTIPIFNHLTEKFRDRNILTVLIHRGQYELFQLLFNQNILDYYSGSSVDLFPLMHATLYLEREKNMPGKSGFAYLNP